jgi:hypothetical protein
LIKHNKELEAEHEKVKKELEDKNKGETEASKKKLEEKEKFEQENKKSEK